MDKKEEESIGFWGTEGLYGCFSNFYPCKFTWVGQNFCCFEQAFMYSKAIYFVDYETANKILKESDPLKIKHLGREVKNYDDEKWSAVRSHFMFQINIAKFQSNSSLKETLLKTGDAYLYEDSPFDYIWGIGKKGTGQNLLGKVLMEVRTAIREG